MESARRLPLHTCGVAMLAIAQNIHTRALEIDAPIGSLARLLDEWCSVAKPLIRAMLFRWLALLSIIDGHGFHMAAIITSIFPYTVHFFDKVDSALKRVENLPDVFTDLIDAIPLMLHRSPWLESAVLCAVKWINLLLVAMSRGKLDDSADKETKTDDTMSEESEDSAAASSSSDFLSAKGSWRPIRDEDQIRSRRWMRERRIEEEDIVEESMYMEEEDPVLLLFDEGWQGPKSGRRIYVEYQFKLCT